MLTVGTTSIGLMLPNKFPAESNHLIVVTLKPSGVNLYPSFVADQTLVFRLGGATPKVPSLLFKPINELVTKLLALAFPAQVIGLSFMYISTIFVVSNKTI